MTTTAQRIRDEKLAACEAHIARGEAGGVDRIGRPIAPKSMGRERAILEALKAQDDDAYSADRAKFDVNSLFMDGYDLIEDVD
jgi:hypothetical protein